jgi:glycerophosphoryl diester phosphodiesterase
MKKTYFILVLLLLCHSLVQAQSTHVRVASHRGDWRSYANNSIESIESCIRMGVDIVEIDVAKTKNGRLILMHDRKIDRTTNGKGPASDFTLEELNALNLRNGLGRVTGFKIPTKALKDPDGTWGYLIDELGAGILQTDRHELMLEYLKTKKRHD